MKNLYYKRVALRSEVKKFSKALSEFPTCCIGAWDEVPRVSSLVAAAEHEWNMYRENQDGCVTYTEACSIQAFLRKHQ